MMTLTSSTSGFCGGVAGEALTGAAGVATATIAADSFFRGAGSVPARAFNAVDVARIDSALGAAGAAADLLGDTAATFAGAGAGVFNANSGLL